MNMNFKKNHLNNLILAVLLFFNFVAIYSIYPVKENVSNSLFFLPFLFSIILNLLTIFYIIKKSMHLNDNFLFLSFLIICCDGIIFTIIARIISLINPLYAGNKTGFVSVLFLFIYIMSIIAIGLMGKYRRKLIKIDI